MVNANIFFFDTNAAASHLAEISGKELDWWGSSQVRSALDEMRKRIARPIGGSHVKAIKRALTSKRGQIVEG